MDRFDIAIIGAGIAGTSVAAAIGGDARCIVLEAEDQPGYHATGRSAAFWEECYGGPEIVPLTRASGPYLRNHGFLKPRGALYLARAQDEGAIDQFFERFGGSGAQFERIGRDALAAKVPGVRDQWDRAIWQGRCADIDVAALHSHYIARARQSGAEIRTRARVTSLARSNGWRITLADGSALLADRIVNAAGAWADDVAQMAGARPCGITPLRRTVVQLRTAPAPPTDLPLCLDISGEFYFKPEAGRVWLSPHDETPSAPVDAAPEEIDVATAIDRFQQVVDWHVEAVERKWAGLRSFAPDRLPVYGHDPRIDDFFWFAGQGGYGIQTSPAAAQLAADLLLNRSSAVMDVNLCPQTYDPARYA